MQPAQTEQADRIVVKSSSVLAILSFAALDTRPLLPFLPLHRIPKFPSSLSDTPPYSLAFAFAIFVCTIISSEHRWPKPKRKKSSRPTPNNKINISTISSILYIFSGFFSISTLPQQCHYVLGAMENGCAYQNVGKSIPLAFLSSGTTV